MPPTNSPIDDDGEDRPQGSKKPLLVFVFLVIIILLVIFVPKAMNRGSSREAPITATPTNSQSEGSGAGQNIETTGSGFLQNVPLIGKGSDAGQTNEVLTPETTPVFSDQGQTIQSPSDGTGCMCGIPFGCEGPPPPGVCFHSEVLYRWYCPNDVTPQGWRCMTGGYWILEQ